MGYVRVRTYVVLGCEQEGGLMDFAQKRIYSTFFVFLRVLLECRGKNDFS